MHFRCVVFYPILDILTNKLDERFKSFRNVVNKFQVLSPAVLQSESCTDDQIREMATDLLIPQHAFSDVHKGGNIGFSKSTV